MKDLLWFVLMVVVLVCDMSGCEWNAFRTMVSCFNSGLMSGLCDEVSYSETSWWWMADRLREKIVLGLNMTYLLELFTWHEAGWILNYF